MKCHAVPIVVTQVSFPAGGRIDLDFELNGRVFLYYRMCKYSALQVAQSQLYPTCGYCFIVTSLSLRGGEEVSVICI